MNYGNYCTHYYQPQYSTPYATNVQVPLSTTALAHPPVGQQIHRNIEPGKCRLEIRQEPEDALVTLTGKEKSRKPIDPPPILQFYVDNDLHPNKLYTNSPNLFCTAHLVHADDQTPYKMPDSKPPLIGNLCSSIHRLKDSENIENGYFIFGDISVRAVGVWRIMFTVFDLQKDSGTPSYAKKLTSICTNPFRVQATKDYKGLNESTYLTRAFSDQGVRLRLRKEQRQSKRKADEASPEPSEDGLDKRQRFDEYIEPPHSSFAGPVQPPASIHPASPSLYPHYLPNNLQPSADYYQYSQHHTQADFMSSAMRTTAEMQPNVGTIGVGAGAVMGADAIGMDSTDTADYGDHLGAVTAPTNRYQERFEAQQQALLNGATLHTSQRY